MQNFKLNSKRDVAVATDYYLEKIDEHTPRGVKLQLLGQGGVLVYGQYNGDPFWTHFAPLPRIRKEGQK